MAREKHRRLPDKAMRHIAEVNFPLHKVYAEGWRFRVTSKPPSHLVDDFAEQIVDPRLLQ